MFFFLLLLRLKKVLFFLKISTLRVITTRVQTRASRPWEIFLERPKGRERESELGTPRGGHSFVGLFQPCPLSADNYHFLRLILPIELGT